MADCKYDTLPTSVLPVLSQDVLNPHGIFPEVVNPHVIPQLGDGIIYINIFILF